MLPLDSTTLHPGYVTDIAWMERSGIRGLSEMQRTTHTRIIFEIGSRFGVYFLANRERNRHHGTTTLFAALVRMDVHLVMDNYGTHKHPKFDHADLEKTRPTFETSLRDSTLDSVCISLQIVSAIDTMCAYSITLKYPRMKGSRNRFA